MTCKNTRPVLLVEDDEVDVMTVKRSFNELRITNPLHCAGNGQQALEYLKSAPQKPCFILLDLNMPRMDGLEFLRIMRKNPDLKNIPVVVLTVSIEETHRMNSFELGVAGYIVKPVDYRKFVEAVKTIHLYWKLSEIPE